MQYKVFPSLGIKILNCDRNYGCIAFILIVELRSHYFGFEDIQNKNVTVQIVIRP